VACERGDGEWETSLGPLAYAFEGEEGACGLASCVDAFNFRWDHACQKVA